MFEEEEPIILICKKETEVPNMKLTDNEFGWLQTYENDPRYNTSVDDVIPNELFYNDDYDKIIGYTTFESNKDRIVLISIDTQDECWEEIFGIYIGTFDMEHGGEDGYICFRGHDIYKDMLPLRIGSYTTDDAFRNCHSISMDDVKIFGCVNLYVLWGEGEFGDYRDEHATYEEIYHVINSAVLLIQYHFRRYLRLQLKRWKTKMYYVNVTVECTPPCKLLPLGGIIYQQTQAEFFTNLRLL